MKTTKRLLAVLMAAVLLCVGMPFAAQAEEVPVLDSGKCGSQLSWTFDETGNLSVSGSGAMYNYDVNQSIGGTTAPWRDYSQDITSVIIDDNVTSIGNYAFYLCINLESVSIGENVKSIGAYAFENCTALDSIVIPRNVESIGTNAFFSNLRGIDKFGINHDWWPTLCLFYKDSFEEKGAMGNIYALIDGTDEENTISEVVNAKLSYSIDRKTRTLTIRNNGALVPFTSSNVPWLKYSQYIVNVVIENGCTTVSSNAFYQCHYLKHVYLPEGIIEISNNAFYECVLLQELTIPDTTTLVGDSAFYNCTSLQQIDLGHGLKSVGNSSFYSCTMLKDIIHGDGLNTIGASAFKMCSSLKSIDSLFNITTIGGNAFSGCSFENITLPDTTTSIGGLAFSECKSLKSVILGAETKTIGNSAFLNCSALQTVAFNNKLNSIYMSAFQGCTSLSYVDLPQSVNSIGSKAFYENSLRTIVIRNNSCSIESDSISIYATIYGYLNSTAELHAEKYGNVFIVISDTPTHEHDSLIVVTQNHLLADCTHSERYDEVWICSVCGFEVNRETIIVGNALGHEFGDWYTTVSPTCTKTGTERHDCTRCETFETRDIDPLGHDEQTYSHTSTCAENGFTITICTRCGETLSKEILPRLDHNWTSEVTQNPTCTAQGVKTYTCADCGETYTEPVDVLAHEWDDGKMTKEPSCTEAGEMTYTCATGGETRTEPIDKLDHDIVLVAGKAATCIEPGLTDGWQCKNCKKWFAEQQTISALNHDPHIGKVVEPTCTDPGYTPFICTRCDKTGATETAEVKTEITVKPTCSTEGELTLIAAFNNKSFYGQTKTKTLPRDPDAHVFKVTVTPPTCIDEGYTTHACTLCRYGYSDGIVPANGHTPVTDEAVPATCEQPGLTEGSHCSVCGEVLTAQEETPLADHADADNDGKCDMCGEQMRGGSHCKYCGKIHGGAFGWLTKLIHSILAIFKR